MHTKEARTGGGTEQRLYGLSAWRETPYSDEQRNEIISNSFCVVRLHPANRALIFQAAHWKDTV